VGRDPAAHLSHLAAILTSLIYGSHSCRQSGEDGTEYAIVV